MRGPRPAAWHRAVAGGRKAGGRAARARAAGAGLALAIMVAPGIPPPAAAAAAASSSAVAAATASSAPAPFESWYPFDIRPPAGTQYPCALRALPPGLPGIPPTEHRFIDHVYSLILRATQAKLVMLKALPSPDQAGPAWVAYQRATVDALRTLRAEPPPAGLERFQKAVASALELQMTFFSKAIDARRQGQTLESAFTIPEGRHASARLQAAWREMMARYPAWPADTRDSIYHHLCALDLF
jgi:hypothetical protein